MSRGMAAFERTTRISRDVRQNLDSQMRKTKSSSSIQNLLANPRNLKAETAGSTSEVAAHGRPPSGIEVTKAARSTEQPDRPKVVNFNYV